MKTISDSDWLIVLATLQKQRDVTLSRSEHKRIVDVIARVEGGQAPPQSGLGGTMHCDAATGTMIWTASP
jgi:hypothetical protein